MNIHELEIFTPNLAAQTQFYSSVLELKIREQTPESTSFQIGESVLKLTQREAFSPYHYAINIPSNQENEAMHWLKERLDIIPFDGKEIQFFEDWNANAIYFFDADGNIGELIARKDLNNPSEQAFSADSLLEISEIGIPTSDIKTEYGILHHTTDVPIYSGSFERFCSIGDEHGLFIVINKSLKKEWFPTTIAPESADFRIKLEEQGKEYQFAYFDEKLIRL